MVHKNQRLGVDAFRCEPQMSRLLARFRCNSRSNGSIRRIDRRDFQYRSKLRVRRRSASRKRASLWDGLLPMWLGRP